MKDYTNSGNCDKTAGYVYTKYMYEIMKLELKIQDDCVYLLFEGHLSTNTTQTRKF